MINLGDKNYKNIRISHNYDLPHVTSFTKDALPNCIVSVDRPIFKAEPSNITVTGFEPFKTYEIMISFRNSDQIARKIRVEQSENQYFIVSGLKKKRIQSEKVAPGMEMQYVVKFFELECITERETFTVPIKALGNVRD
jgi:hydrocephalus-inducing protein